MIEHSAVAAGYDLTKPPKDIYVTFEFVNGVTPLLLQIQQHGGTIMIQPVQFILQ